MTQHNKVKKFYEAIPVKVLLIYCMSKQAVIIPDLVGWQVFCLLLLGKLGGSSL